MLKGKYPTPQDADLIQASQCYDLKANDLKILKAYTNYIYESGHKILQLTSTNYRTFEEIATEIVWLNYLNENDCEVVKVVKSNRGNWVESVGEYAVICYEKIIGQRLSRKDWTAPHFHKLGKLTGKLHKVGQQFEATQNPQLLNWDEIPKAKSIALLPKDDRNLPELALQVQHKLNQIPFSNKNYGLIHYDIHHGNYFLRDTDEKFILFDFEMMCKSWYVMEIAVVLYYILNSTPIKEESATTELFLNHFIAGYQQSFEFDKQELEFIPTLLLYRDLLVYGYTFYLWPEGAQLEEKNQRFRDRLAMNIKTRSTLL